MKREIPFGRPMIGEEERRAVDEVLSGPILTHGPRVKQFEADFARFCGAPYAVATASCTASLHLAYFAMGIGPGDEVIVPAQTHTATAHAVELCGGTAIFVDSEAETGNIDLDQVEQAITPRTRGLAVVHYLGMPVNMAQALAIARKHNLFLVEDCALAIGTYYRGVHAGLHGDIGCFSFYPVKHITTGEGGMVISRSPELAQKIANQRAFGIDRNIVNERKIPGLYDVQGLGFNYRLNEVGAALGIEQMKRLPGFLEKRCENYAALTEALQSIDEIDLLRSTHDEYQSSYYCQHVLLRSPLHERRFEIINYLNAHGVGTSIYYPQAVPHMTYYREKYGIGPEQFPIASHISNHGIAFPVGPHVDGEDMHYIAQTLKQAIIEVQR